MKPEFGAKAPCTVNGEKWVSMNVSQHAGGMAQANRGEMPTKWGTNPCLSPRDRRLWLHNAEPSCERDMSTHKQGEERRSPPYTF